MAVRLISPPATGARLRPASDLACLTVPGLISTPRRRPRRPEDAFPISLGPSPADGCVCTSDITPAYPTICQLTKMNLRNRSSGEVLDAARRDSLSADSQRQDQHQDRRQDGGKHKLSHSNHLLCGPDRRRQGLGEQTGQSTPATAAPAGRASNKDGPMGPAHPINLNPPTAINSTPHPAKPRQPRAAPPHPAGNVSNCVAIAGGITASAMPAIATNP